LREIIDLLFTENKESKRAPLLFEPRSGSKLARH
jgi:hypothetical protein